MSEEIQLELFSESLSQTAKDQYLRLLFESPRFNNILWGYSQNPIMEEAKDDLKTHLETLGIPWSGKIAALFDRAQILEEVNRCAVLNDVVASRLKIIGKMLNAALDRFPSRKLVSVSFHNPERLEFHFSDANLPNQPDYIRASLRFFVEPNFAVKYSRKLIKYPRP